uniref:RING-type domain-containing protein n=1 Tax=Cucumis melo TaxID=3656 RepID=A0A9I9CP87_CUCME
MTTATATVKLPTEKLMRCLTCPLCHNLFTNATTISECLHTFCRDCISEKIAEEELEGCPICNTNLGGVPLEKLRADHTMDDLREKIFPCKVRKEKEPEKTQLSSSSSVSLPTKRKEGSYTTTDSGTTKMLSTSTSQESFAKQQCLSTMIDHKKLNFDLNKQNNGQVMERITDDLNKKEASVTCSNDCKIQDTLAKAETIQIDDNYCNIQEHGNKPIMERVERGSYGTTSGSIEHEKLQDISREKRLASSNGSSGKLHDPLGDIDADRQCNKSSSPIWFALVASDHQEGNEPLPQISSNYLRVRLVRFPTVEISFKGQPVSSTLHLHDIVELWRHTTTTVELIQISVGSSAKDFVMVLSYGRKCYHPGKFTNICAHLNNGVQ